jgi:hypothetical protein
MFALAGFVHQMLGTASDYIRYISGLKSGGRTRFETMIIEIEASGQDSELKGVTAKGGSVRELSQYKFSMSPDEHQIYPRELRQIAQALKDSARRRGPNKQPGHIRTDLVLRSNRKLSNEAQSLLGKLKIKYERYNETEARSNLEAHASRFGVYGPDKLDHGIRNVIGYLVRLAQSPEPRAIKNDEFDQALTNLADPRSIAIGDAADRLQEQLKDQISERLGLKESSLVFRSSVETAMREWAYDALIGITGNGGCGKTTALWQILTATVSKEAIPRRLAHLIFAKDIPSEFGNLIERWRGGTSSAVDSEIGMTMLSRANQGTAPPILMLGLDGVDEIGDSDPLCPTVKRFIRYFWRLHQHHKKINEPPPARLIVTCRDRQDLERFIEFETGIRLDDRPRCESVEEFSDPELLKLLQGESSAGDGPAKRLREALEANLGAGDEEAFPIARIAYEHDAAACLPIIRHPILWHCFSRLSPLHRQGVIHGSNLAYGELAKEYFDWFNRKARGRRQFKFSDIDASLSSLALKYSDASHPRAGWYQCVTDEIGCSRGQAADFYDEAVSSALIIALPQNLWRWRHAFLVDYLRKSGEELQR